MKRNGFSYFYSIHEQNLLCDRARAQADPIKIFEADVERTGLLTAAQLETAKQKIAAEVKAAVDFASRSEQPPAALAKQLEYPDAPDTDYNTRVSGVIGIE